VSRSRVEAGLDDLARLATASKALSDQVTQVAARFAAALRGGGTLYFCGNGGSAADAQHLATEYMVRFRLTRRPFAAIALTTDASVLTAAGNDLGFEQIFARQVEALCGPGDILVLHSTSGRSPNLLAAARAARSQAVATVAFLGRDGGPLAVEVDDAVIVASDETSQIQVIQMALEHLIVELVEDELLRRS
jgi:D-sedoheptulose 7-phosphate isomerase